MPIRILVRAALAGVCMAGATASVITYVSEVQQKNGAIEARAQRCDRAVRELDAAESWLNPSLARDVLLANCLLSTGHPGEADSTMIRAVAREPENAQAWAALALFDVRRGRIRAGRAAYAHALTMDPHLEPFPF